MLSKEYYRTYVQILKDELVPAMGCTEPIAIAYAGAVARKTLGALPERVEVAVSRNIIKNVKSVVVPHTGGLRGIEAAAAAGIVAGDAAKELEVISHVEQEDIEAMGTFLKEVPCSVCEASSDLIFDIQITLYHGEDRASVRITDFHTNLVHVSRNGEILLAKEITGKEESALADKSTLTIEKIFAFAKEVDLADVREVLERQVRYNMAIAEEGLCGNYGANIGKVLLATYGDQDVKVRAKAMAAAGSDARMNGCELPVVINAGSGNQGMTCSLPVLEYAKERKATEEETYRALALSNLIAIHQKTGIGRLSAYCGAVSAGAAAGEGIAYLCGGGYKEVIHTVVNALAIVSGIICDGAKASCAAKIASAVDAGILGYNMYLNGQEFYAGDGIVTRGIEATIHNVGRLGRDGMRETNEEIIKMMIDE